MLSLRLLIIIAAIPMLPLICEAESRGITALDYGLARQYCDQTELRGPEGLWIFPDDETTVLICRSSLSETTFDILVVETPDCRLNPGEKVGELQMSAHSKKFKLNLSTSRKTGILTDSHSCSADLTEDGDAFIMHPRRLKVSFRPFWFLPGFWRALRADIDNPSSSVPYGLVRIYPRSTPLAPFYL